MSTEPTIAGLVATLRIPTERRDPINLDKDKNEAADALDNVRRVLETWEHHAQRLKDEYDTAMLHAELGGYAGGNSQTHNLAVEYQKYLSCSAELRKALGLPKRTF